VRSRSFFATALKYAPFSVEKNTSSKTIAIQVTMTTKVDSNKYLRALCPLLCAIAFSSFASPVSAASNLTFHPSSPLFFVDTHVSSISATENVELGNDGSSTLEIDEVTKSSTVGCSQFIIDFQQTPVSLENGEIAIMAVAFAPTFRGSHSCDININSNDPDGTAIFTVNGVGVGSELAIEPGSMAFADTHIGEASGPQYFTLTNVGDAGFTLTIFSVDIQASDNDEDYVIGGFLGGAISSGSSESVEVTFVPQSSGDQNATIGISSDANVNSGGEKQLLGRGTERLIGLLPKTVSFPHVFIGHTENAPISIANNGEADLAIFGLDIVGGDSESFSIFQPDVPPTPEIPIEIAGNDSYQLVISCTPERIGAHSSQLVVSSNADNETESTAVLQCDGEEAPEIIFWNGFEGDDFCDPDFNEPDTEAQAFFLGSITDCESVFETVSGILGGPADTDWYTYNGSDAPLCISDPSFSISGSNGLRRCLYVVCDSGSAAFTCPAGSTQNTSPDGKNGCCTTDDFLTINDLDCMGGSDDSVSMWLRIDQTQEECNEYSGTVNF
jgi:hypothetical protein